MEPGIDQCPSLTLSPFVSRENGDMKFLTKGDNNMVDDRGLYAPGQLWLQRKDVIGRARGFVPFVGIVTILMNDYPKFKVRFDMHSNDLLCEQIDIRQKIDFSDI